MNRNRVRCLTDRATQAPQIHCTFKGQEGSVAAVGTRGGGGRSLLPSVPSPRLPPPAYTCRLSEGPAGIPASTGVSVKMTVPSLPREVAPLSSILGVSLSSENPKRLEAGHRGQHKGSEGVHANCWTNGRKKSCRRCKTENQPPASIWFSGDSQGYPCTNQHAPVGCSIHNNSSPPNMKIKHLLNEPESSRETGVPFYPQ